MKHGQPATETLQILHKVFGKHSISGTVFLNIIHVSRLVEFQLKMTNIHGDQAPAK
jgi:hypothetical protein